MRLITPEEANEMAKRLGKKYSWTSVNIYKGEHTKTWIPSGFAYKKDDFISKLMTDFNFIESMPLLFRCVKCNTQYIHVECDNCSDPSPYFKTGYVGNGLGIYCNTCERGFSTWTCSECGAYNPTNKTLYMLSESKCFIATAAYGSIYEPDVTLLRQFRDIRLNKHLLGQWFIQFYEYTSPPLAEIISNYSVLRWGTRKLLLAPIVKLVQYVMK